VRVTVYDGKYTVVSENGAGLKALRYGEEWRDCTGDGLILALAQEIETLRDRVKVLDQVNDMHQLHMGTSEYVRLVALDGLWKMLGVNNQTEAVEKIRWLYERIEAHEHEDKLRAR
jgi:hypothetical protein